MRIHVCKQEQPRVMGWRRPCFGEAPLARFRAKQAQEGETRQKKTWEKAGKEAHGFSSSQVEHVELHIKRLVVLKWIYIVSNKEIIYIYYKYDRCI